MKRTLRAWAALLTLLLILPCVSCGNNRDNTTDTLPGTSAATLEESTEPDPAKTLDVPAVTFGNYDFNVISADLPSFYVALDVEGLNNEIVNDAIYTRNRTIEDIYQIKFHDDIAAYYDLPAVLEKQVKAGGDGDYDLIMLICRNAYTAALNNYLLDYESLPYVDVDKEYYFRDLNNQFTIGHHMFFAYSAESINVLSFANCILFNKVIANQRNMPDFYEMLANRAWTFDEMFKYAGEAAFDADGDGKLTLGTDTMGLIGDYDKTSPAAWIAADEYLITKDENDMPAYTCIESERFVDVMQDVIEHFSADYVVAFTAFDSKRDVFMDGKSFMWAHQVGSLNDIRSMTDDYGVLPWPKYDLNQENYVSRAEDAWLHCVPTTCSNADRTSIILQVLAYYSYHSVYDAYYEQALSAKYVRDSRSVDSLKMIVATMTVDIGDNVWYEKLRSQIVSTFCSSKGKTKVASTLKRYERTANLLIKDAVNFAEQHNG